MTTIDIFMAVFLGIVEGITEFLPVSSTAHLLLIEYFTGFSTSGETFAVLIQLGAILAILTVYFKKLWSLVIDFPTSPQARRFIFGILLAFIPAAVIGLAAHDIIKTILFKTPLLICCSLIIGGIILLWVDKKDLYLKYDDSVKYPLYMYFVIGLGQCLAMIPGTSRSGATVVAAMLMGSDKRAAAEFSFFLAIPTMLGAFVVDLYKNFYLLNNDDVTIITIGFVAAFFSGIFVVKSLLDYVSKHGFAPFAYWRIFIGAMGIIGLYWM